MIEIRVLKKSGHKIYRLQKKRWFWWVDIDFEGKPYHIEQMVNEGHITCDDYGAICSIKGNIVYRSRNNKKDWWIPCN